MIRWRDCSQICAVANVADVFLSYKREDLEYAKKIAAAIAKEGFSVFFDVHDDVGIDVGEGWDHRLERELAEAKAVVVLWSQLSVMSNNVRDEARRAAARQILIPVKLGDCAVPLGLGLLQTVDLEDWNGNREDTEWRLLIDRGVRRVVEGLSANKSDVVAPPLASDADQNTKGTWSRYGTAASILAGAVVLALVGGMWVFPDNIPGTDGDTLPQEGVEQQQSGMPQANGVDAFVKSFQVHGADDEALVWLGNKVERNLVEHLWSKKLRVMHGSEPIEGDQARLFFTGDVNHFGDEFTISISLQEDGRIAGTAEISAPKRDFESAYRSLPTALLYLMNRNIDTLGPAGVTKRPTPSAHAWWMFEEARRNASIGQVDKAVYFLERAREIDPDFATALWAKGDLLSASGDMAGSIVKQEALKQNPDLQRRSIHSAPIDPMPALRSAALSSDWTEIEPGLSFRQLVVPDYEIRVSVWSIDTKLFLVEARAAQGSLGQTAEQIRAREGGVLAVNGGFWDRDAGGRLTPSGLFISQNVTLQPYRKGAGSGVFLMTPDGPRIQYARLPLPLSVSSGVQSGPIIIESGGEIGIKTKGRVRSQRTAVCISSDHEMLLMVVEGGLSLFELASLLGIPEDEAGFDCNMGLNLGGGPTTQASFHHEALDLDIPGLWKTQTALVVSRR